MENMSKKEAIQILTDYQDTKIADVYNGGIDDHDIIQDAIFTLQPNAECPDIDWMTCEAFANLFR